MYKLVYIWYKSDGSKVRITRYGFRNKIFKCMVAAINEDYDIELIWCLHLCLTFKIFCKCLRKETSYEIVN